jgi:hypothetical protein
MKNGAINRSGDVLINPADSPLRENPVKKWLTKLASQPETGRLAATKKQEGTTETMKAALEPIPEPFHSAAAGIEKGKMLVIEDSLDQWFMIQKSLKSQYPQINPVLATNYRDVVSLLEEWLLNQAGLPELILLDLYLPKRQDGWQTLENRFYR